MYKCTKTKKKWGGDDCQRLRSTNVQQWKLDRGVLATLAKGRDPISKTEKKYLKIQSQITPSTTKRLRSGRTRNPEVDLDQGREENLYTK